MSFRQRPPYARNKPGSPFFHGRSPTPISHMPFDPVSCASIFPGTSAIAEDITSFTEAVMSYHSKLTPLSDEQQAVASLVAKVTECLEAIALYPGKFEQGHIEETRPVGSFKKGTMLAGHCIADLVVILRDLPSLEAVAALGNLLKQEFMAKEKEFTGEDEPQTIERAYGFDFTVAGVSIRVAFSTHQSNFKRIKPGVHVSASDESIALAAIRHARWAEENAVHPNVKALIRILKDFQRRFAGFNNLTPWHIDLLSYYAVLQNPQNQPLSVPIALRRIMQILSAGIFLPSSSGFIDPCEPNYRRVHVSMTFSQQDELCCVAQTMCRVIAHDKFSVLFVNLHLEALVTAEEIAEAANATPGVRIVAPIAVCMEQQNLSTAGDQSVPESPTEALHTSAADEATEAKRIKIG